MKRDAPLHPKIRGLAKLLAVPHYSAVGLASLLWNFTSRHAPGGNIGKWSDQEIADGVSWDRDAKELIGALVSARLVEQHDDCRLVVHDWSDHCEDSVHMALARRGEYFSDGTQPKLTRLGARERAKIEAAYASCNAPVGELNGSHTHGERTARTQKRSIGTLPGQARPSPALPAPKPRPAGRKQAGVFAKLAEADLRDSARLMDWFLYATAQNKPVLVNTEENLLNVFGAAERALEKGINPVAMFIAIVSKATWRLISIDQEERGRRRLADLRTPPPASAVAILKGVHDAD